MRIEEFIRVRGAGSGIPPAEASHLAAKDQEAGLSFGETLQHKLEAAQPETLQNKESDIEKPIPSEEAAEALPLAQVEFSKHAVSRLASRSIDLSADGRLERLNKGIEAARAKGANDTLILVDKTAFLVSVKNNRVITTMSAEDIRGNVFTNIDSTVIM